MNLLDDTASLTLYFAENMPSPRHFPPPWTIEELNGCFIVSDANGQKLAYTAPVVPEECLKG
jgi:hypothetical protein